MKFPLEKKAAAIPGPGALPPWLQAVVFGLAYFASAELSRDIAGAQDYILNCWLPSGLFLGVLLLTERRHWLWLVLAGGLGDLAYNYFNPFSWTLKFMLLAHLGNSASAVMGAWLVRRLVAERPTLDSVRELIGLLVFGGLLSIPLSATIGALLVKALTPQVDWLLAWCFWYSSDLLGVLLLTPVLLAWRDSIRRPALWRLTTRQAEAVGLWLGAGVTLGLSYYFQWPKLIFPLFVVIPYIIWASFRFGLRGVSVILLSSVLIAEWFIDRGFGRIGIGNLSVVANDVEMLVGLGSFSLLGLFPAVMLAEQRRAESALRASEARLRAIIDHEPECVKLVDKDGLILEMNPAGLRMIEADTLAEVQNRSVYPLIAEEHRTTFRTLHHKVLRGESGELEFDVIGLKGTRRSLETHATPLRDAAGAVTAVLGLTRDITARRQADAALRKSEAGLAMAQRIIRLGSWEFIPATGQWTWSDELFRLFQLDPAQGVPTRAHILAMLHPDDRATFQQTHDLARPAVRDGVFRLQLPDGHQLWIEEHTEPIFDQAGRLVSIMGTTLDVTARQTAEARLREQASLLNQTSDAIIVASVDNRFTFWNEGAERLTGWPAAEVLGQTGEMVFGPDARVQLKAVREAVLATGVWHGELPFRRKDGRTALLDLRVTLIRDAAGRPKARLSIATDITEKKQLEEQVQRAQRTESLGMLAAGIAHDLNNILSPVLMAAPLLRTRATHPSDLRVLDLVEKSAQRGSALVQQILSFAHGANTERVLLQARHILLEVNQLMAVTFPKSIAVESDIPADLWPVVSNSTQLHQVVLNLCINARDAMPTGGTLTLTARNEALVDAPDCLPSGSYLIIEVADTGTGMTPEVLTRIWEPFFTTKAEEQGTGLGLATARGILAHHGGTITVESAAGRGSVFRVYLPATMSAVASPTAAGSHDSAAKSLRNELVLVVDDDADVRQLLALSLTQWGYRILQAKDSAEAMEHFLAHSSDISLIIFDLDLPGQDGLTLARQIQGLRPDLRVLFVTGVDSMKSFLLPQLPAGAPLLKKPFARQSLREEIERTLAAPAFAL